MSPVVVCCSMRLCCIVIPFISIGALQRAFKPRKLRVLSLILLNTVSILTLCLPVFEALMMWCSVLFPAFLLTENTLRMMRGYSCRPSVVTYFGKALLRLSFSGAVNLTAHFGLYPVMLYGMPDISRAFTKAPNRLSSLTWRSYSRLPPISQGLTLTTLSASV